MRRVTVTTIFPAGAWTLGATSNVSARDYRDRVRKKVQRLLGGKCEACGETDWIVLQVSHRIPVGRTDASRQPGGMRTYQEIIRLIDRGENPKLYFNLFCANDHVRHTHIQFRRGQIGSASLAATARRKARHKEVSSRS
jgi:hypothetical protein